MQKKRSLLHCSSLLITSSQLLISSTTSQAKIILPDEHNKSYESRPALFGLKFSPAEKYDATLRIIAGRHNLCDGNDTDNEDSDDELTVVNAVTGDIIAGEVTTATRRQIQKPKLSTDTDNTKTTSLPSTNATTTTPELPIALLVKRGTCSFESKARNAMQIPNVKYLIIYNDRNEPSLVPMSASNTSGIDIGLLFTSHSTGEALMEELNAQGEYRVILDGDAPWSPFSQNDIDEWMLACMVGSFVFIFCFGCACLCVYSGFVRMEGNVIIVGGTTQGMIMGGDWESAEMEQRRQGRLLTRQDVFKFREVEYGGDKSDSVGGRCESCSVCLEDYELGERLRVLPCGHSFHTDCILPWLTERYNLCPLCKSEISPGGSDDGRTLQIEEEDGQSVVTIDVRVEDGGLMGWIRGGFGGGGASYHELPAEEDGGEGMRAALLHDERSPRTSYRNEDSATALPSAPTWT